jgi:hypothetical protein
MVTDQNRCYLPVELQTVVASILREYPDDFVAHLEGVRTLTPLQAPEDRRHVRWHGRVRHEDRVQATRLDIPRGKTRRMTRDAASGD